MCALQENTSFTIKPAGDANIFTTETLTVAAKVHELIDSFTISAPKNRLWSTKTIQHPTSQYYQFLISFYETGPQNISITTFRSGGDDTTENILLNVKNPLRQNDIPAYNFADTIILSSGTDVDKGPKIIYHWLFGKKGQQIQSPFSTIKTAIAFCDNLENTGLLWVSDSNFESPRVPFMYKFYDSTPPQIICVNDNYDKSTNIIRTSDTIFKFQVLVTDRGSQSIDSVTINGAKPDINGANIYTSVIKNVNLHTQANPIKIAVKAVDNILYRNDTTEYFFVIFDEKVSRKGSTILKINSIADSSLSTSRNNFNIFGTVEKTMNLPTLLNLFLNDVHIKDTIIQGNGSWNCILSLKDGANVFYILAKDSNTITVDSQAVMVFYHQNAADTIPPVILSKEINGKVVDKGIYYSKNDSVTIQISTFDAGSGVQKIKYNDDSLMVKESNFKPSFVIRSLEHERQFIHLQVVDFKGNSCKDSINICQNIAPAYTLTHPFPYVVFIGSTYSNTINFSDNDPDSVILTILSKPNSMTIDTVSGNISWTPQAQDTNGLSFQLFDGLEPTISEFYKFAVMDPKNMSPNLEISDETSIPPFLEANSDTLIGVIKIKAGTGKQPFLYTADLVNKSKSLLTRSSDSQIVWNPTESDTGIAELRIIVEDSLRFCDTLFRSIAIVPQNKNPSTLSFTTTLDTTGGRLILGGEKDTAFIHFYIDDADDPRTEKHIITIKSKGQVSTMRVDSDSFTLKLTPKSNLFTDTLQVIINDNTGTSDTISVSLIYSASPDHFPQLYSWFNNETFTYINGALAYKIDTWDSKGTNAFTLDNPNGTSDLYVHSTINGYDALRFNNKNDYLINLTEGNLFDSSLTIFFVAKYDSIPVGSENLTLISSNGLGTFFNRTTGFGVTKEGYAGFFSRTTATGTVTDKKNSNIFVEAKKWHVFSFSTIGADNHLIPVDISVDKVHDTMTVTGYPDPGLILGRCYKEIPMFPWCGDIAEVIIFNRVLSFEERISIELFLAEKYAL